MTVRINFLPKTYQPPKQLGPKEWTIAAGVAAGVVATSVFYMSTFATAARLENQVKAAAAKHQQVKADLALAAEIRAREEKVAQAEKDLRSLVGRPWSTILLTLADLTPQQVTWHSLTVQDSQITLKATGRGLVDVAQLFGGLVDHSQVEQVSLRYVNEQGVPVKITVKAGEKDPNLQTSLTLRSFRQLEFEMVITLVRPEGGAMQNGT